MIRLTEKGNRKVNRFIKECEAKRKEILDAGLDTAEETEIPTVDDIIADIEFVGIDEEGEYYNSFGVTDHYEADTMMSLWKDIDFVETDEENDGK